MKQAIAIVCIMLSAGFAKAQVKVGQQAPEIALPDVNGQTVKLSSFKGKVVLIDFWASWCGPCRAANPGVVKLYNKLKASGFEVFGVSIDAKKDAWIKAIAHDKIPYTQVNDAGGWDAVTAAQYGVDSIPNTFLLDKNGVVVAVGLEGAELEKKIESLLK